MVKNKVITLRIEPDDKTRLVKAAKRMGMSLTTFMEHAGRVAAMKVESAGSVRTRRRGVPQVFLNVCDAARTGGSGNYARAAEWLLEHVGELLRDTNTIEEWKDRMRRLKNAGLGGDPFAVVEWFEAELPNFIELIPPRRHDQFLNAVINAINSGGLHYFTEYETTPRQVKTLRRER